MQHVIKYEPSFPMLQVSLQPNETLIAEAGTMVARATTVEMEVKLNAGRSAGFFAKLKAIFVAMVRKMVGGDTSFVNHFTAPSGGWVWLAPALSGSMRHIPLNGQTLVMSAGAFVACAGEVDLKLRWGGLRAILAKEGAFFVEASGRGDLWLTSYGAIDEIWVNGTYVVDNGHLVAFDSSLQFKIKSPGGGVMGFVASGEGLVCEFTGQGRVLIQSRNTMSLVDWVGRLLP
ncbi:MAG: TIGR00266 family protein [Polyangiaceae bacterium]|nr:TIGR00266 family protein [Polyangiaceae bacterium]